MSFVDSVRIPEGFEDVYGRAETIVRRYFQNRINDPGRGMIEISGERYVLVRAGALSVEFFDLVRDLYGADRHGEADAFARNILFDLAHALGKADAKNFHKKMEISDPFWQLSSGPPHFAHMGWALVDVCPQSGDAPEGNRFYLIYDHLNSFEADAWVRADRPQPDSPVCIMNAGYSAGWSEQSFGIGLVASEILCRARGDETCRFMMAPPDQIEERLRSYLHAQPHLAPKVRSYAIPDLFARKRIEEELRRARDELEARVQARTNELTLSNERLRHEMSERAQVEQQLGHAAKLEAIGRLSGGIAHDFNNLLGVILTRIGLLERRLEDASSHPELRLALTDVDEIKKAGERAAQLTRQLLTFSRTKVLCRERLDLNEIVCDLARTMVPLIGDDIVLQAEVASEGLYVYGDRAQIEQSLMNMVVNARDAMPQGGMLVLRTGGLDVGEPRALTTGSLAAGRYNMLSVGDTGVGMSDDVRDRIFDPFYTTKPPGKGTGLGLSTVYGIIQQSGGGIDVRSMRGGGTIFDVFLPAASPGPCRVARRSPPERFVRGTEVVLLVEDERELRRVVAEVLSECGYRVYEAASPHEALAIAHDRTTPIDLLLTDVVMPKMGGGELAKQVTSERPEIRVLFISGYASDFSIAGHQLDPGVALLQKPFFPDELASKVRDVLDAPR